MSYDDDSSEHDVDKDYNVDYDADEVEMNEGKQLLFSNENHHKRKADHLQETVGRTKREIESSVVPVISESYGVHFHHNSSSSEGLRLYDSLVANGGTNEPKDSSVNWESTENPIKNYHR
ncbi:hypothetical protein C0J52_15381 [Blattella germanica]|nr:hypothetical protein C0J52_15381 [Blattella germanica]